MLENYRKWMKKKSSKKVLNFFASFFQKIKMIKRKLHIKPFLEIKKFSKNK